MEKCASEITEGKWNEKKNPHRTTEIEADWSIVVLPFYVDSKMYWIFRFTFYVQSAESDLLKKKNWNSFGTVYFLLFSALRKRNVRFFIFRFRWLSWLWMTQDRWREKERMTVKRGERIAFYRIPGINIRFHLKRQFRYIIDEKSDNVVEVGEKEDENERVLNNVQQPNKSIVLCELLQIGILCFVIPL